MKEVFFILLIIFAILVVQTNRLRRSMIYLGVFSLISSLLYLLYQAPDVAIAEAIIGSTLSTILLLVALKKYKIFRIYFSKTSGHYGAAKHQKLVQVLRKFVIKEELELDLIYTSHTLEEVIQKDDYDVVIEEKENQIIVYGDVTNYHYDNLQKYLKRHGGSHIIYSCLLTETGEVT